MARSIETGALTAEALLDRYCALLYDRLHSFVQVVRITGLDRHTVKRRVQRGAQLRVEAG